MITIRLLIILIVGNILIETLTGNDPYFSIIFFLLVTSLFLIIGGLKAQIYISIFQIVFITIIVFSEFVGGRRE